VWITPCTALEHNNRVFYIDLYGVPSWQLERLVAAMQKPFPELTILKIGAADKEAYVDSEFGRKPPPVFPDSFLGGSAPCLKSLRLNGIPFPGLPTLLLSSHDLVNIHLWDIPPPSYFTPEEMATCLSPMKRLKSLTINFMDSPSLAAGQYPPSLTRIVLPALTSLNVYSTKEFLEGLVSTLDVPSLKEMEIGFLQCNEPVSNISELPRFISRIEKFETFDQADIYICYGNIQFEFSSQTSSVAGAELSMTFLPMGNPELLEDLTPVVCSFFPPLSHFKCLTLYEHRGPQSKLLRGGDIRDTPMQRILYSFTAVTDLFISKYMATNVSRSVEGLSEERTTAMLPALRNIFVAEFERQAERTQGAIQEFIAAKGLAGRPVTFHRWEVKY
jgi:hypothetical protein